MTASSNRGRDWPDPIPLGPPTSDPLPVDAVPGWMRCHVKSVAAATQTPTDLAVMQGLAALSTALANKALIQVRTGYTEPMHLWTAVVLPPASRKSAVHKHMVRPISAFESERVEATKTERQMTMHRRDATENALKSAKKDYADAVAALEKGEARDRVLELQNRLNEIGQAPPPRLLASDVTAEKLTQLMAQHHGRIAVLSPEGEIFRLMAGRYRSSGPHFDPHKRAWTGDEPIRDDRMGREGSHVRRPALTLGICAQPSIFETLNHQRSFRGEGVLARFLYAVPESGIGSRLTGEEVPELDEKAARDYKTRLRTLLELDPADVDPEGEYVPHRLFISDEARTVHNDFAAEVEAMLGPGGRLSSIQDWGGKLVGQSLRIAGLLHAGEHIGAGSRLWSQPIRGSTFKAAVRLARATVPHALVFFDALETDETRSLARYAWKRIRSAPDPSSLTVRDVHRRCQGKSEIDSVDDLREILRILEDHFFIWVATQESTGGRPRSPRIYLNPALTDGAGRSTDADRSDRSPRPPDLTPSSVTSVNPSRQADKDRAYDESSREEG